MLSMVTTPTGRTSALRKLTLDLTEKFQDWSIRLKSLLLQAVTSSNLTPSKNVPLRTSRGGARGGAPLRHDGPP